MRILRAIGTLMWNLVFLIFMYWVWSTGTLVGYLFFGVWCCGLLISAIKLIFELDIVDGDNRSAAMSQMVMLQEDDELLGNCLSDQEDEDCGGINPATGLPMIGQWDIHGNTFGISSSSDRHW